MTPAEKQAARERCERAVKALTLTMFDKIIFTAKDVESMCLADLPAALDEIDRLEARLAIDQPNPFPEGYDAIDLLNDRVKALEGENERLKELEKNRGSFLWMDITPTADLPSRILSAYLDYSEWSDNTLGMEPSNPIIVEMNRARHERNALIEQALASLGRPE